MSRVRRHCGAVRAAFTVLPSLTRERLGCILPAGHVGAHRDTAGQTWPAVPAPVPPTGARGAGAATAEPEYRSPHCAIGRHTHCQDAEPRPSDVPGVHYLTCTCPCHRPAPVPPQAKQPAPTTPAGDADAPYWYRLCWTVFQGGRAIEHGTFTARDIPALLRGLHLCLEPLTAPDPAHLQALADTAPGWTHHTPTTTFHTHRLPDPLHPCPTRRRPGCPQVPSAPGMCPWVLPGQVP